MQRSANAANFSFSNAVSSVDRLTNEIQNGLPVKDLKFSVQRIQWKTIQLVSFFSFKQQINIYCFHHTLQFMCTKYIFFRLSAYNLLFLSLYFIHNLINLQPNWRSNEAAIIKFIEAIIILNLIVFFSFTSDGCAELRSIWCVSLNCLFVSLCSFYY